MIATCAHLRRLATSHALACALACSVAHAAPIGTVVVDAERPADETDAQRRERESLPLATIIDARHATAAQASVADLLSGEVGVRVRSRGGLGSFTSVSLRGSEESEVAVFLDGVPLSRAASGAIDLSEIPADGLERIEIYRGAPPIQLGAEAVGGVINLVSRRATKTWAGGAQLGGGSFGARNISMHAGGPVTQPHRVSDAIVAQVSASYRGAEGDFPYFQNAGTLLYRGDDSTRERKNNDFDQGNVDVNLDRRGTRPFHLGVHGFIKDQGAPGTATLGQETQHARLQTGRLLLTGQAGHHGRVNVDVQSTLLYERYHFQNPLGEAVGPYGPAITDSEAITAGLGPRLAVPVGRIQTLTFLANGKIEYRRPYDLLKPTSPLDPAVRGLLGLAAADEVTLLDDRLTIYGGVRFDLRRSSLLLGNAGVKIPGQKQLDTFFSPRINVKYAAHKLVTLRASAGRYVRFPTILEQFGDGAFLLGAPALHPEASWGGDVAVSLRGDRKHLSGGLEGAFFGRRSTNLISYVPGGATVMPINVGDARVLGVEARADCKLFSHVDIAISYTYLDARDITKDVPSSGHLLSGRAPHAFDARVGGSLGPLHIGYELDYLSQVPRDSLGLNSLPARVLHAIVASATIGRFELGLEVRNIADTRIVRLPLGGSANAGQSVPYPLVDFYNFPLPGRSFYATARINN
ncbi:MAG: TonB-dependent receptor [Polyangia bacterium]